MTNRVARPLPRLLRIEILKQQPRKPNDAKCFLHVSSAGHFSVFSTLFLHGVCSVLGFPCRCSVFVLSCVFPRCLPSAFIGIICTSFRLTLGWCPLISFDLRIPCHYYIYIYIDMLIYINICVCACVLNSILYKFL